MTGLNSRILNANKTRQHTRVGVYTHCISDYGADLQFGTISVEENRFGWEYVKKVSVNNRNNSESF